MSVASTAEPTPSAPAARPRGARVARHRTGGGMVVVGVAAVTFLLALNGGFYHLADRDALAVLVWWALGLIVVLGLWPVARAPPGAAVAAAALAAFASCPALSALWAPAAETALTEANRVLLYWGLHSRRARRAAT